MDSIGCALGLLGLAVLPLTYVLSGWALSILWEWFIVPTFDAPVLSIPMAIGLAMIVSHLTGDGYKNENERTKTKEESYVNFVVALFYSIFRPLMVLLIGWIVLRFVR